MTADYYSVLLSFIEGSPGSRTWADEVCKRPTESLLSLGGFKPLVTGVTPE
jgi:hypothetical protein